MKIWEPKPPGTFWATPGLLEDCFYFEGSELRTLELAVSRRSLATIPQSTASHYKLR